VQPADALGSGHNPAADIIDDLVQSALVDGDRSSDNLEGWQDQSKSA